MPKTIEVFRIVCAWCGKVLQEGTPGARISHGICTQCAKNLEETY